MTQHKLYVLSYRASSALSAHRLMTRPSLHTIWSKASRFFPSGGFSSEKPNTRTNSDVTHMKYINKNVYLSGSQWHHHETDDKHLDRQQSCGCWCSRPSCGCHPPCHAVVGHYRRRGVRQPTGQTSSFSTGAVWYLKPEYVIIKLKLNVFIQDLIPCYSISQVGSRLLNAVKTVRAIHRYSLCRWSQPLFTIAILKGNT